jgi:hypothetical protein
MDRKIKLLVYFLNLLSKKNQYKDISFDKFKKDALDSGFKNYSNNYMLFNFYNENVGSDVKWEDYDLKPFLNDFISKLEIIKNNNVKAEELFTNPIDTNFRLDYSSLSDYVEFYNDSIHLVFQDRYSEFLLELINLDTDDIYIYNAAIYGDCHTVEYYEDEIRYMFSLMDGDCKEKLSEIAFAVGKTELANKIKSNFSDDVIDRIIDMIKKINENYLQNLFDEYALAINRASCESIKDSYRNHFPYGIKLNDNTVVLDYDFLINYVKENPSIQTFSDLKGHKLIDDDSDITEATYEYYNELDREFLNHEYFTILDNLYDKIMDDEETISRVENIKEFENIIKSLKFTTNDDFGYYKIFKIDNQTFKRFSIEFEHIDYYNKVVKLKMTTSKAGDQSPDIKLYKIPFDEIADYVYSEKLHESILFKIKEYLLKKEKNMKIIVTESQLKFLIEQHDYTSEPPQDSQTDTDTPRIIPGLDNCGNIMSFIDSKITEMLKDGKSKEEIAQILSSNVKIDGLSPERQDQLDPYNIMRSEIVREMRAEKGNVPVQRLVSDCSKKFSFHKNSIKNKSIFKYMKIDVVEMPHGGAGDDGLSDAQCGRPNWGKASRSCMRPIFSGPHPIIFGGMKAK